MVQTGRVVDEVPESKAVCKYSQQRLTWSKDIGTTHFNRHYKTCTVKHELIIGGQTQLQFGSLGTGAITMTLSSWMYLEEKVRTKMVKLVAAAELPLAITDN